MIGREGFAQLTRATQVKAWTLYYSVKELVISTTEWESEE